MKKIFIFLSICAFALCFSSFHNEKVATPPPPPDLSFLYSCLTTSTIWHNAVRDICAKRAQIFYTSNITAAIADPTSDEAKICAYAKQVMNSKVGDNMNAFLINYFTNPTYLTDTNIIAANGLTNDLDGAFAAQFYNLVGVPAP